MDNLLKAAENFQGTAVEVTFDEDLLIEFMKKVNGIILLLVRFIIYLY